MLIKVEVKYIEETLKQDNAKDQVEALLKSIKEFVRET